MAAEHRRADHREGQFERPPPAKAKIQIIEQTEFFRLLDCL